MRRSRSSSAADGGEASDTEGGLISTKVGKTSEELGAGSEELGVGSEEVGAGSAEVGARSEELGAGRFAELGAGAALVDERIDGAGGDGGDCDGGLLETPFVFGFRA